MIDAYIGTIIYFAGNYVPEGWYACDGRIFKVEDEPVLYAVIRAQYGGDDSGEELTIPTFALPKIDDLNGCKAIICYKGIFPPRS